MAEYFSTEKTIELRDVKLLVKPSEYDSESSNWANVEIVCYLRGAKHPTAKAVIVPGSDTMKVIASQDGRHIAVFCVSQWYEDLYIFELPNLRKIASFEGVEYIDGASEGIFLNDYFITLPTISYEGGCGGLRRVSLADGKVETLLPPDLFSGLNVPLKRASGKKECCSGAHLSSPFGLLGFTYDKVSGVLILDYVPGQIRIFVNSYANAKSSCDFEFIARSSLDSFQDAEGNQMIIGEDERKNNWWLQKGPQRSLDLLRIGSDRADATFRDGQEDAIRHVFEGTDRLLVVQKTGWGKSFVYFIATKLLREGGSGPALLISPLLSLMRNQIAAATRMGLRAATINSENRDEWPMVKASFAADEVDILLISPEQLAKTEFLRKILGPAADRVSFLVIDEAHCISDWGHEFRTDYRRIERMLRDAPDNLRVLATTATANNRVMDDLTQVLGPKLALSRGDLNRPSLTLQSIRLSGQAERLAWLAQQLAILPGSGIIYALTKRDANQVAAWLRDRGLPVEAYSGGDSGERREVLENALLDNRVKALVATTALGMGFDKPDLSFVIHYQAPGSVVHYYQQVGRAGRALETAYGILLSGQEETDITDWFISSAFPSRKEVALVLEALEGAPGGLSIRALENEVNLSRGRIGKVLDLLALETPAPVVEQDTRWQLTAADVGPAFWQRADRLTALRKLEQRQMQDYVALPFGEHMPFLIAALDGDLRAVSPPRLPALPETVDPVLVKEAVKFLRRTGLPLEPRKKWPDGGLPGYRLAGKIAENQRAEVGRALSVWGDAGWGELVRHGKYTDGRFSDELVDACVQMLQDWHPQPRPAWVTAVPSLRHPQLVPNFAQRLAGKLGLPFEMVLTKADHRPEQKTMANSIQQARNLDDAFGRTERPIPKGPVLLVDDMVDSRWTLTVCSAILRESGAGAVWPMALAITGGGD